MKKKKETLLRDKADLEQQLKKIREKELKEKRAVESGQKLKRQVTLLESYPVSPTYGHACAESRSRHREGGG